MTTGPAGAIPALLAVDGAGGAAPALTFYQGRARVGQLAYAQLAAAVERVASGLNQLGVRHGDRVALASPNRLEVPVALLALWRLGAVAVPLNPTLRDDWHHIIEHANVCGCLVASELRDHLAGETLAFLRAIEEPWPDAAAAPRAASPTAPAIILYTSGTTGRPKGVVLSQRNLLTNGSAMAARFGLARTTQLAVLPLYHAHALGFGLMSALASGGHLVFTDRFDPWAWAEIARSESVEVASVVPTLLPLLAGAHVEAAALPRLRALLVSSAPLPREVARDIEARTQLPLVHGWGLSEFTNFACCLGPLAPATRRRLLLDAELPSVGPTLPGTEVTVRDANGRELGESRRGELWVRGDSRMLGYYRDVEATARTLEGDWLRTGDEGYFLELGGERHFFISGRLKEIIIRGGEKHSPLEVERRLIEELPELAGHLCVVGFAHALQGEEIGAYLELQTLSDAARSRILQAVERLPVERRPKIILHGAQSIPRTHTGKVQRKKLQALFAAYAECRGPSRLVPVSTR
jgi:long-chain acyl-CoA synthetase